MNLLLAASLAASPFASQRLTTSTMNFQTFSTWPRPSDHLDLLDGRSLRSVMGSRRHRPPPFRAASGPVAYSPSAKLSARKEMIDNSTFVQRSARIEKTKRGPGEALYSPHKHNRGGYPPASISSTRFIRQAFTLRDPVLCLRYR